MPYRWIHVAEPGQHLWLLRRNCALSPCQLGCWFGTLGAVSLAIAALFASWGAWPILPFAFVEVAALGLAFVVHARHAADFERIVVSPGRLVVECETGGALERVECVPDWIRVEYDGARREPIRIVAGRREVTVGRFVPDGGKEELVRQLRASLAGWRA